jgi:NAD+ diphosphatase
MGTAGRTPEPGYVAPYSESGLERATERRGDPAWAECLGRGDVELLVLWGGRCIVGDDGEPSVLVGGEAAALVQRSEEPMLLGISEGRAVFAVDLGHLAEREAVEGVGAAATADLRDLVARLDPVLASRLAYARGLAFWHDHARYCGACGHPTAFSSAGHVRQCTGSACGELLFPRISPAVIVLVEAVGPPPRCLLGRHRLSKAGSFATLAGFVEIGESLEGAVRREVAEETGIEVGAVTYRASQAWPFPGGLMLAFRAEALCDTPRPDGEEVVEARWFTRDELSDLAAVTDGGLGRHDSIDRFLLEDWLDRTA